MSRPSRRGVAALALLTLAGLAACTPQDQSAPGDSANPSATRTQACANDQLQLGHSWEVHSRHRQAGELTVVRRRGSDQRQGFRVRRRVRGGQAARLRQGGGELGRGAFHQRVRARSEELRRGY